MDKKSTLQMLFFSLIVGLTACSETTHQPSPGKINPKIGWNGQANPVGITIAGKNFMVAIEEDLSNKETPDIKKLPEAILQHKASKEEATIDSIDFVNSEEFSGKVVLMGLEVGWYNLIVANPDGETGILLEAFEVTDNPPPVIESIGPNTIGLPAKVTIEGKEFDQDLTVLVGEEPVTVVSITSTAIVVEIPEGLEPGIYDIIVINPDTQGDILVGKLTIISVVPCNISGVVPAIGCSGDAVTIKGTAFGATAGSVSFESITATITSWSDTSIVVSAPSGGYTKVTVMLAAAVSCSLGGNYSYDTDDGVAPTGLAAAPEGGSYCPTAVVLSASEGVIYYTTDGSEPIIDSPVYAGPIDMVMDTTLRFMAVDVCGNQSLTVAEVYNIDGEVPTGLVAAPAGGSYCVTTTVVLGASGATTIYYTTDHTWPTTDSPAYTGPIDVSVDTAIKFMAVDACGNKSAVKIENYYIDTVAPTGLAAAPEGGSYCVTTTVNLSASDGTIYYTLNGNGPTTASLVYTDPIDMVVDTTLKFMAVDVCGNQAATVTEVYSVDTAANVNITSPVDGASLYAGDVTVSGTADPDIPMVTVTTEQGHSESSLVDAGGNWSVILTGVTFPSMLITAEGTDDCGNIGSDTSYLIVLRPAILAAEIFAECQGGAGGDCLVDLPVNVYMMVYNIGDALADNVVPSSLKIGGDGGVIPISGPTPGSAIIPGGSLANFSWTYQASTVGSVTFSGSASGYDTGLGAPISSPVVTSNTIIISPPTMEPVPPEALCLVPPVLTVEAGTEQYPSCDSAGVILGGSPTASGGSPPYTYQWSCNQPVCNISDVTIANPTASPVFQETIYTVTVTDSNDCQARDSVSVWIEDAPKAVVTASPTVVCITKPVDFDGSGSWGVSTLVYIWNFGDGTSPIVDGPATYTYTYSTGGIYRASLTVADGSGAGCGDSDLVSIYVSGGGVPTGRIGFFFEPSSIPADGVSTAYVASNVITDCAGTPLVGQKVTVMTDRGTILDPDVDPSPGIQLLTDAGGMLFFKLRSDRIGGDATVMARSLVGNAEGAGQIKFFESTSHPIVIDFSPSGLINTPPLAIYARFNEDMEEASVCAPGNFYVVDVTTSKTITGTCIYNLENRTAIFTPGAVLDMNDIFKVTVCGSVFDTYFASLDGNYNGLPDLSPEDDFIWQFGNVADQIQPMISCLGHIPDPFSPDGDLLEDFTTIKVFLEDMGMTSSGIRMWEVVIQNKAGNPIQALIKPVEGVNTNDSVDWDGKNGIGVVVANDVYNYLLKVIDNDGNYSYAVCDDDLIQVESALNPGYFRGSSFTP